MSEWPFLLGETVVLGAHMLEYVSILRWGDAQ